MASRPTDPRFPPSNEVDYDAILARLLALKRHHFPQHTAQDAADPVVQVLRLMAALGAHGLGRLNSALMQMDPYTATCREALISMLRVAGRPLLPVQPSRGTVVGRLEDAPVADSVVLTAGARFTQPNSTDPVYSCDEDVATGPLVSLTIAFYDDSLGEIQPLTLPDDLVVDLNDAIIFMSPSPLMFDTASITFDHPSGVPLGVSVEYRNAEYGTPDLVEDLGGNQLRIRLDTYLHADVQVPLGLRVRVLLKTTGATEDVVVTAHGLYAVALTSYLGQTIPSESAGDYTVLADWRPCPSAIDGTGGMHEDGDVVVDAEAITSEDDWWEDIDDLGGYAIRLRVIADGDPACLPTSITPASVSGSGDHYVKAAITQGIRQDSNIGSADGSAFQHLSLSGTLIDEPVFDPEMTIRVGDDDQWFIVEDFSNSGSTSKHAVLVEDPSDGWGVTFGDGSVGELPTEGENVRVTYRTASIEPGDLDPGAEISCMDSGALATDWRLPRGTEGYAVAEASTREEVLRFRYSVLPQLALRTDSAVTSAEIVAALTAAPSNNRATFITSDDRMPFSRARFSGVDVAARQYVVATVGLETDPNGEVSASDLDEATTWLNGTTAGIQVVDGHGPMNTYGLVVAFTPKPLRPIITVQIIDKAGVREQVDQVIRAFLQPHARDTDGDFRWQWQGVIPVAMLFADLWAALPDRYMISVLLTDGGTTWNLDDTVPLSSFELPTLSPSYNPDTDITVEDPP